MRLLAATCFVSLLAHSIAFAQSPSPASIDNTAAAASDADRLPVKRVVLYKNGVGFFEHLGKVRGTQSVSIDFTSGQLDDALKSLTTVVLGGGKVAGISFNTDDLASRKLGALSLPVEENTSVLAFLGALRGARVGSRRTVRRHRRADPCRRVANTCGR